MVWMYNQPLKWRRNWEIRTAVRISFLVKWPHEKLPNSLHFIPFSLHFSCKMKMYMVEEAHVWTSEDNRKKSILSFHQLFALTMSSKDQTLIIRLVGKQPYLLSHFTSPLANFQMFKINMKQSFKNEIMK